ncbi:hypothetical protein SUGI_1171430 [Cryptomeria japonica]|nr:hypothetical protein SUGI_1171430 [Cryptomeria japonica]
MLYKFWEVSLGVEILASHVSALLVWEIQLVAVRDVGGKMEWKQKRWQWFRRGSLGSAERKITWNTEEESARKNVMSPPQTQQIITLNRTLQGKKGLLYTDRNLESNLTLENAGR